MKTKKKISSTLFIIALFVSILYLFLAPRPLSKEYQFNPVWKINTLSPVSSSIPENEEKLYFRLGQNLGYFTKDGKISFFKTFPNKASISNSYFSFYSADAKNIPFYKTDGSLAGTIKAYGYPYFVEDQIYVFLPGGASFAKCDETGNIIWRYEGTLPITAFCGKTNYTAVGFADGSIKLFENNTGNVQVNFTPGGSDYPVILGLDITEDGKYIASVSGQEKQRFILAHCEENQPKIIYHKFLQDNLPYRTLVHFTKDGNQIIYNYQNTIGIYNITTQKENSISIKNKIISIRETNNLVFLLGADKKKYTVYMIEKSNKYEGSFSFEANTAFIQTSGENLFIGKDNTISRISVTRE